MGMRLAMSSLSDVMKMLPLLMLSLVGTGCGSDSSTKPESDDQQSIVHAPHGAVSGADVDLVLRKSDGTFSRKLLSLPGVEYAPEWSPDGRNVVFSRQGMQGLWIAGTEGGARQLISGAVGPGLSWSPDGKYIAFHLQAGPNMPEVAIARADGSEMRSLTRGIVDVTYGPPSWSPDGRIAFRRASESQSIWTMQPDGTGLAQVTFDPGDTSPRWSPDGRQLAFLGYARTPEGAVATEVIFVVNADGSGRRQMTAGEQGVSEEYVSWSPDGQWILYEHHPYSPTTRASCSLRKVRVSDGTNVELTAPVPATWCKGASWRR